MSEASEQAALFEWAELVKGRYPELALMYHIPNGGSRNKIEAAHLKQQGVKSGVPDIHLPVARGGYHSLYIEMKYDKNKPTDKQIEWLRKLKAEGNAVAVAYSAAEAQAILERYLRK